MINQNINKILINLLPHFPELDGVEILLKEKKQRTTLTCIPKISTLFGPKRKYIIGFNTNAEVPFDTIPHEAQIGIMAHELCHIVDYESKNIRELLILGCMYLSENGMRSLERKIDGMTIDKGFGKELYSWANHSFVEAKTSEKYKKNKKQMYLSPDEISALL